MRTHWIIAIALLGLPLAGLAGTLHKWVDAEGNVHFSDQPPPQQSTEQIEAPKQAPADPYLERRLQRQQRFLDAREAERQAERDKAQHEAEAGERLGKLCEEAQDRLKLLDQPTRLYRTLENGEKRYLSDQERAAAKTQTERFVEENCR